MASFQCGTYVDIYLNDTVICNSTAEYEGGMGDMAGMAAPAPASPAKGMEGMAGMAAPAAAAPAKGMEGMAGMAAPTAAAPAPAKGMEGMPGMTGMIRRDGGHKPGGVHIKQMSTCSALGPINKGDTVFIDANYDFQKFAGMKSDKGAYTDVMGIAILYIAVKV